MQRTDVIGIEVEEDFFGDTDGEESLAGVALKGGGPVEEIGSFADGLEHHGGQDVFLAGEMLIDGSFGVFDGLGDAVHVEGEVAVLDEDVSGGLEDELFALLAFALFAN